MTHRRGRVDYDRTSEVWKTGVDVLSDEKVNGSRCTSLAQMDAYSHTVQRCRKLRDWLRASCRVAKMNEIFTLDRCRSVRGKSSRWMQLSMVAQKLQCKLLTVKSRRFETILEFNYLSVSPRPNQILNLIVGWGARVFTRVLSTQYGLFDCCYPTSRVYPSRWRNLSSRYGKVQKIVGCMAVVDRIDAYQSCGNCIDVEGSEGNDNEAGNSISFLIVLNRIKYSISLSLICSRRLLLLITLTKKKKKKQI